MNLTKDFTLEEFLKGQTAPEEIKENLKILAYEMQKIRTIFERPIIIHSGYRSPAKNKSVGGAENSLHMYGLACDFSVKGVETDVIFKVLNTAIKQRNINLSYDKIIYERNAKTDWIHFQVLSRDKGQRRQILYCLDTSKNVFKTYEGVLI